MNIDYVALASEEPFSSWGNKHQPYMFTYLEGEDLARCTHVNRSWNLQINAKTCYLWKTLIATELSFPLPLYANDGNFKALYVKKKFTVTNIKNNQPTRTFTIEERVDPFASECIVNDRLVVTNDSYISFYNLKSCKYGECERSSYLSTPHVRPQREIEQTNHLTTASSHEEQDFFSCQEAGGYKISFWKASTGKRVLSEDDFGRKRDPFFVYKVVKDKIIYKSNERDGKHIKVVIGDFKNDEVFWTFSLPDYSSFYPKSFYRHSLFDDILISTDGRRIIAHRLSSSSKVFELYNETQEGCPLNVIVVNSELLVQRIGSKEMEVYHIEDGTLTSRLNCILLSRLFEDSKEFVRYRNLCLTNPLKTAKIEVWDLVKREYVRELSPPNELNADTVLHSFKIHLDRLIVCYKITPYKDFVQIWNLNDFTTVSMDLDCYSLLPFDFIDDYIFVKRLTSDKSVTVSFWNILTGKAIGSRDLLFTDGSFLQGVGFHKGKMWTKLLYVSERDRRVRWIFDDYCVPVAKAKPQSHPLQLQPAPILAQSSLQKIIGTAKSIFCSCGCPAQPDAYDS